MILNEQEIMNAICLNMAERKQVQPTQVQVQLMWDEDLGYSAEVIVEGRNQYLIEGNMKEAVERYMLTEYGRRVFRSEVQFEIEDEMICIVPDE